MSWIHVNGADVNNVDIFAFVNLKENLVLKGRVVVGSDLKTKVLVMCDKGEIQGMFPLPQWAYYSKENAMLKTLYEEIHNMSSGDFNMNTLTPKDYENMASKLVDVIVETPEAVILKYVPDLTITDELLDQFVL